MYTLNISNTFAYQLYPNKAKKENFPNKMLKNKKKKERTDQLICIGQEKAQNDLK